MKRILFALIALCFTHTVYAANALNMGVDRTVPSNPIICAYLTGSSCPPIGPMLGSNIVLGVPQVAPLNQMLQVSGPYPIPKQSQDMIRGTLGNFPANVELSSPTNGSFSNWAVVGATAIPAGDFTGAQPTWPSGGGAFYGLSNNAAVGTVGVYAAAGTNVPNAIMDGINSAAANCPIQMCATNTGFDFQTAYGTESDVVIEAKSDGSAPAGQAAGFVADMNAAIQPTGSTSAFLAATVNLPWKTAFATNNGTAITGVSLGATSATGPANSQTINLFGLSGAGAPLEISEFVDSLGGWNLNNNTAGTTTIISSSFPQWVQNGNSNAQLGNIIKTTAAGTAQIESIFQTGTAGSTADFLLTNNTRFDIQSGTAVGSGITVTPLTGPIALNSPIGVIIGHPAIGGTMPTVATLPTCNTAAKGALNAVSDATAPAYNVALTGGGTVSIPVYCNGTAWTAH